MLPMGNLTGGHTGCSTSTRLPWPSNVWSRTWPGKDSRRLRTLGFEVDESQRESFPDHVRLHTFDGHGNRVEVLQPV